MALVDPNIAMSYKGIQLADPLAQYGQVANIQNALVQQEFNQDRLEQIKQDRASMQQLQQRLIAAGRNPDLNEVFDAMLASNRPELVQKAIEGRMRLVQVANFERKFPEFFGAPPAAAQPVATAPMGTKGAAVTPVPERALTVTPLAGQNALAAPSAATPPAPSVNALQGDSAQTSTLGRIPTNRLQAFVMQAGAVPGQEQAVALAQEELKRREKVYTVRPGGVAIGPGGNVIYTAPTTPSELERMLENSGLTPAQKKEAIQAYIAKQTTTSTTKSEFERMLANSGLTPEDQKKAIQAYIAKQTTIPGPKPLTAAQQQRLQRDRAADKSIVKAVEESAALFERDVDRLLGNKDKDIPVHPGLSGITGVSGMFPSAPESMFTSGDARAAKNLLDSLEGKVMALGRKLASQEGKLGNMAVQEWRFVRDFVAALDPTSKEFPIQLRSAVDQFNRLVINQKMRFDDTYGGGEESTAGPTGGSAGGSAGGAAAWEDAYKTYLGSKK